VGRWSSVIAVLLRRHSTVSESFLYSTPSRSGQQGQTDRSKGHPFISLYHTEYLYVFPYMYRSSENCRKSPKLAPLAARAMVLPRAVDTHRRKIAESPGKSRACEHDTTQFVFVEKIMDC
jgi:hypothetical protein